MNVKSKGTITDIVKNKLTNKKNLAVLATALGAVIIGIVILIALNTSGNSGLRSSRDIFTLYNNYNMTVVVVFDEEPPIVQFIAPDGNLVDMENIRYRPGSNFIQYFLPNAMPGV